MKSRSQRRRDRRRQALINAAQQLIAQNGIASLTVLDVTDLADMAVGSFYTYFPSKEALLEAAIWEDMEGLGQPDPNWAQGGISPNQLQGVQLLRTLKFFEEHRALMQAVFGPGGSPEQFYRGIRMMERGITESLELMGFVPAERIDWIATLLGGIVSGGIRYLLDHPEVSAEEMTGRIMSLLRPLTDYTLAQPEA
jgi:AcrR family transcriptional regulator